MVLKSALFDLSFFFGTVVLFSFLDVGYEELCIAFSDVLTVLHSHNVGVINLSLVIINPQVSL